MTVDLASLIGCSEVLPSSGFIKRITALGVNEANARQMLVRNASRSGIWRSTHLALPGNGRLFAHEKFRNSPEFLNAVLPFLEEHRPGLARLTKSLKSRSILLRAQAARLLASPAGKAKNKNPTLNEELATIEELGIGMVEGENTSLARVVLPHLFRSDESQAFAIQAKSELIAEGAIASVLINQFKEQSLISWNGGLTCAPSEGLVVFNNHFFSATGWSYLQPMLRIKKESNKRNPSPFALDVYARQCTEFDVKGFIDRLQRSRHNPATGLTFLGAVAAYDFEKTAWSTAKGAGLMTINLRQYFGETTLKLFKKVEELLEGIVGDKPRASAANLEQLAVYLDELKSNPWVKDLRSIGFEVLAGLLLKADGWENLALRTKVNMKTGEEREIDVSAERGDNAFIIECKAQAGQKALIPEHIAKFYQEVVPAYIASRWAGREPTQCRAEIWTTGTIGKEARDVFDTISVKRFVKKALVDKTELLRRVPRSLSSCKQLIQSIASPE